MSGTRSRRGAPRLFAREELVLRPTGHARFRAMARRPPLPLSELERRQDEDRATMDKLRGWGIQLAERFRLRWNCGNILEIDPPLHPRLGSVFWFRFSGAGMINALVAV